VKGAGVSTSESDTIDGDLELKKEPLNICENRLNDRLEEDKSDIKSRTKYDLPSPILLSGSQINEGEGWFLAIAVGKHS
jgi:hypothetical protein